MQVTIKYTFLGIGFTDDYLQLLRRRKTPILDEASRLADGAVQIRSNRG